MPPPRPDIVMDYMTDLLKEGPLSGGVLDKGTHGLNKGSGLYLYNNHLSYAKDKLIRTHVVRKFKHGVFTYYYLLEQVPNHLRGGLIHDPVERAIFCDWLADNHPEVEAAWRKTVGAKSARKK